MPKKEPYPSDLNEVEWELLRPLMAGPPKLGRPLVLDAIFCVVRSGCAWRLLPHDLPPWRPCYDCFAEWRESGLWQELNGHLRDAVREKRAKKSPQRCDLRRAGRSGGSPPQRVRR